MIAPRRLAVALIAACAFAAGWWSVPSGSARAAAVAPPARAIAATSTASSRSPTLAVTSPAPRFVTAQVALTDRQRELLTRTPAQVAQREMDATRAQRRRLCEQRVRRATDALCEQILEANGRGIAATTAALQRFLRGEIDQDTFQADYHKAFLRRAIALERLLSAEDYAAIEGIAPGVDPFVALTEGFANQSAGARLGDDILAQRQAP